MIIQRKVGVRVVLLIVLALLVLLLPGMGQTKAYAAGKSITGLGTGSIRNPQKAASPTSPWVGNYVYYGKYNGSPVKYRVLTTNTTDFGGTTMLLDCDCVLLDLCFDNDGYPNAGAQKTNEWAYSDARANLNGDAFLNMNGVFTDSEKAAIAASTKTGAASGDGPTRWGLGFAALNGDKIFLLDAKEVTRESYGYETGGSNGTGNGRIKGGAKSLWWLRSPYSVLENGVGCVYDDGLVHFKAVPYSIVGVSPAFNVNLSSVLFSSEISSEKGSYTLTLKDNNLSISKSGDITRNVNTITVPYSASGTHNRVSVLMTDKTYTDSGAVVTYYGELNSSKQFTLPDGYNTNWKTYILAEQINGAFETDYASAPVEITIPADTAEKKPEETEQNIISDSGEKDEAGSTFYPLCTRQKKVKKNSITFTWNKVKGATSYVVYGSRCGIRSSQKLTTTAATSYTWKKLKKGTYYKIYVVAKNGADVISISKKVHVATSGKSYGNVTSVSVKKKSVKLKKGKTFKVGASFKKKGKIKQHRRLSYESTNPAVATVSGSGKIKAVGKGTCYVYAYTQNGLFKRVKVTVKK